MVWERELVVLYAHRSRVMLSIPGLCSGASGVHELPVTRGADINYRDPDSNVSEASIAH